MKNPSEVIWLVAGINEGRRVVFGSNFFLFQPK
jgi:hypothetical protein